MKRFISFFLFIVCYFFSEAQNTLYISDAFSLRLFNGNGFVFYSTDESAAKENIAGSFVIKNDSLILTTHKANNEQVIFAIYQMCDFNLQLVYKQKQFNKTIPTQFYLLKNLYSDGKTHEDYIWTDKAKGTFVLYSFAENGASQEINEYKNFKKDGKQITFFANNYGAVQREETYKMVKKKETLFTMKM